MKHLVTDKYEQTVRPDNNRNMLTPPCAIPQHEAED